MLHNRLLELRKFRGLTQESLAQFLQITRKAYSLYETGKRQMSFETLCLIADYYDVTIDYLLGRSTEGIMVMTETEKELVHKYRCLDERGKQNIQSIMNLEYTRIDDKTKK